MATTSIELHPIVINPISEPPFECAGNGLTCKGHPRTPVSDLRSWLLLVGRKRKNAKDPTSSKTKAWWHAQLCLYGLPTPKSSLKLAELTAKLVSAVEEGLCDSIPPRIQELEHRLNERFRSENALAWKRRFLESGGSEEAAFAIEDPSAFLLSKFKLGRSKGHGHAIDSNNGCAYTDRDHIDVDGYGYDDGDGDGESTCVLKKLNNPQRASIHRCAEQLGLVSVSANAPDGGRWMVVGKSRSAVSAKAWDISEQTKAHVEMERAAKRRKIEEEHEEFMARSATLPTNDQEMKMMKKKKGGLEGKWHISCKYIEEQWEQARDLSFCIARKRKSGTLVGEFDFGVISGVLKFGKERSMDAENGGKLGFRWRGVDCGTGEILFMDEDQRGWVSSVDGASLKGQFEFMGKHDMSGLKVNEASLSEINETWDDYGPAAYEAARVGRW